MSSMTSTPSRSYSSDSETASIPLPYGMTSRPSIPNPGEDTSISLAPGSPANPTPKPEPVGSPKDLTMIETFGPKHESAFGYWDASTSCLRTYQASFLEMMDGRAMGSVYLETFPHWGLMQDGEFIAHPMPVLPTCGDDSGSWHIPTPTAADVYTGKMKSSQQSEGSMHSVSLPDYVAQRWATPNARDYKDTGKNTDYHKLAKKSKLGGQAVIQDQNTEASLNPDWVERYLMS